MEATYVVEEAPDVNKITKDDIGSNILCVKSAEKLGKVYIYLGKSQTKSVKSLVS